MNEDAQDNDTISIFYIDTTIKKNGYWLCPDTVVYFIKETKNDNK